MQEAMLKVQEAHRFAEFAQAQVYDRRERYRRLSKGVRCRRGIFERWVRVHQRSRTRYGSSSSTFTLLRDERQRLQQSTVPWRPK